MSRFTRKIKQKNKDAIQVIILAAGASARTRSYEPRCLLKYKDKTILETQLEAIEKSIPKYEICIVIGVEKHRLLKRINRKIHTVENTLHETTNSGESMRLGFNFSKLNRFLFIHGDLILDDQIFTKIDFDESFVFVNSLGLIASKEIGINAIDKTLTGFCYNSPIKWCQIAYLGVKECEILERMLWKNDFDTTHLLSFEVIQAIIDNGGTFKCIELKNKTFLKEIDSLKDLQIENTNRK